METTTVKDRPEYFSRTEICISPRRLLSIAVVYFSVAKLGLFFVGQGVAFIWPASGVALAVLLLCRRQDWGKIIATTFPVNALANLTSGNSLAVSLGFAFANSLESFVAAYVLTGFAGRPIDFSKLSEIAGLVTVALFVNGATAFVGAAVPYFGTGSYYWDVWLTWWVADGLGMLIVTPLAVSWARDFKILRQPDPLKVIEACFLVIFFVTVSSLVFNYRPQSFRHFEPYMIYPVLVWAGYRFSMRGISFLMTALAVITVYATINGKGMFAVESDSISNAFLHAQLFLAITAGVIYTLTCSYAELKSHVDRARMLNSIHGLVNVTGKIASSFSSDITKLYQAVCDHAVEKGLFKRVWIGLADPYSQTVDMVAQAGEGGGYSSFAMVPLTIDNNVSATLNFYSDVKDFFGDEEMVLLNSLATELSLAVQNQENIKQRRLFEEALLRAEKRYRSIVENASEAIFQVSKEGRFIIINSAGARMLGYSSPGDIIASVTNMRSQLYADPEQRDELLRKLDRKGSVAGFECLLYRRDRTLIWCEMNVREVSDEEGAQPYYEGTFRDITERKRTEKLVEKRLELMDYSLDHNIAALLRKMLDEVEELTGSSIGFYHFVDEDARTLTLQQWSSLTVHEFCKAEGRGLHYGIDKAGVWADCIRERRPVIHNDYKALSHAKGFPEGHAPVTRELVVPILRNGKIIAVLGVGNKAYDYTMQDVEMVILFADIAWDIVERKLFEEEARRSQTKLIHANKMSSLGILVSSVAHEVNNPNNFIMFNSSLIESAWKDMEKILDRRFHEEGAFNISGLPYEEMRDAMPKLITGIKDGSYRIKNMVDRLREFSRQSGKTLDDRVNIAVAVENTSVIISNQIRKYTDCFNIELEQDLPVIKGSIQQIEQVLINLVLNSLHALPDRKAAITVRAKPSPDRTSVIIEVEDEGAGIGPDVLKRLTEPFFSTKLDEGGTGLGLSISEAIVHDHKGELRFESVLGKGTKAYITLPALQKE
ncbi:MAG: PAS domain S-box protein [Nitrospirae bacterium]|nr:MAG: PAS domain S-box protein [Nitrospirota bacterium]